MKPRAVAIIIDPSQQQVLLIHRRNQGRDYYVLPGGKIEPGETPAEACLREALEETGLHITLGARVASFTNLGRVEHYFLASGFSGKLELGFPEKGWQSAENVYELEWVPAAQLPGLALLPAEIRPVVLENLVPAAQSRRAEHLPPESSDFSFIQISDHHLTSSDDEFVRGFATRYSFRAVLRHIAQNAAAGADFIFSTGDLVENPSEGAYRAVLQILNVDNAAAEMPGPLLISAEGLHQFPLRLLPGNHDDRDQFFKCLFPGSRPTPLMNVAFMHKGIQFVCLDWGPASKAVTYPETLRFLAQVLAANLPSILLMHHQLVPVGSRWLDEFMADDLTAFWELLAGRPVLGIFCGHVHTTYECVVNGVPVFGLRSTMYSFVPQDEPLACLLPPHYRLVTVRGGVLTTQIFEVPL